MYFRIPIIASLVALAFSAASHAYTYHADDFEDLMVRDADLAFDTYFETRDLDGKPTLPITPKSRRKASR